MLGPGLLKTRPESYAKVVYTLHSAKQAWKLTADLYRLLSSSKGLLSGSMFVWLSILALHVHHTHIQACFSMTPTVSEI